MATRTTPGEGDYNLYHPINSFVDVARRVVLQPVRFFAWLPRDRNFVSPLLFALICTEISMILGWLLGPFSDSFRRVTLGNQRYRR